MDKVIVLGRGFLGKTFERYGFEVWDRKSPFTKPGGFHDFKSLDKFDVIINCIGKSNTRWCEDPKNFEEALDVNYYLPFNLSNYCKEKNKQFVHISTGCLYDINDRPQHENDFIVAHCNYTVTKWAGETGCEKERDLILRPRLYFGSIADKNNLLCKLPKFESLTAKLDSLTSVDTIVEATRTLLRSHAKGIFNVACEGYISMFQIGQLLGLNKPSCTQEYIRTTNKLYLVNSTLDITKLKQYYTPPNIENELKNCWASLNINGIV